MQETSRRPLKTREYAWPRTLAAWFVAQGISPNQMSLASIACAHFGLGCYLVAAEVSFPLNSVALIIAAASIQLRLLSNLLDGLMAVEEGKKTATGALYNELPDRIADVLFLAGAGYCCGQYLLGWACATAALLTANVRTLGASLTGVHDFSGPMAKPHRMFVLTVGTLLTAFFPQQPLIAVALFIILSGSIFTIGRRIITLAEKLEAPLNTPSDTPNA